jgi:broad specificity phosphatase PhoE
MKFTILLSIAALSASGLTTPRAEAATTVVYVVRHAEKATQPPNDPPLTPAGKARAVALSEIMAQAHPVAAIHTQFLRTKQTAEPTVTTLHIPAIQIPRDADPEPNARAVATKIRQQFAGTTVLVVGHSDSVPAILRQLGIAHPPAIPETQFNRLFKVTKGPWPWSKAVLVEANYGK